MKRHDLLFCLFLGIGSLSLYVSTLGAGFVAFDDNINILLNPGLESPSWAATSWAFSDTETMYRYLPFSWIAWSFVYALGGLEAAYYHAANIILHSLVTVLVFVFIRNLQRSEKESAPQSLWSSFCATICVALWSWHPLRTELVAWCSGFLYLHATLWLLLSGLCYLRAIKHFQSTGSWNWALPLSQALYLGSLLCYPVTLGYPIALGALTWWRLSGFPTNKSVLKSKWRIWAGVIAASAIAAIISLLAVIIRQHNPSGSSSVLSFPLQDRLTQSLYVLGNSLEKTLAPRSLSPVYADLISLEHYSPRILSICGVTSLLLILTGWLWKKRPQIPLYSLAFIGLMIPFMGFFEHPYFPSDRYSYLPGIVLACALAMALSYTQKTSAKLVVILAVGACLFKLVTLTESQKGIWQNTKALYTAIVDRTENPTIRKNYGEYHRSLGDLCPADGGPRQISRYYSHNASLALANGKLWKAEVLFREALVYDNEYQESRYVLARLLLIQGRYREALPHYLRIRDRLSSKNERILVLNGLLEASLRAGDSAFTQAVQMELARSR